MIKNVFSIAFALMIACAYLPSASGESAEAAPESAATAAEPSKEKAEPLTVNELFKSLKRGNLVLIGYESIVRRRVDAKREITWLLAGVVFLVVVFIAITFKDVWNLVKHHTP